MQCCLGNQLSNMFHGPDSRGKLFGQFFDLVIPEHKHKQHPPDSFLLKWHQCLNKLVIN